MTIKPINLGQTANDGTGSPLREGGSIINANFSELDERTGTAQATAESAITKANSAEQKAVNAGDAAAQAQAKADGAQARLVAGENITIDNTNPEAPVISSTGGGSGGEGTVTSVAGVVPVAGNIPTGELQEALGISEINESLGDLESQVAGKVSTNTVGQPGGVASLGVNGQVPPSQLPNPPVVPANTNDLAEGSNNLYFTASRVLNTLLAGLSLAASTAIQASDSVIVALGKLQAQVTGKAAKGVNNDITRLTAIDATGYGLIRDGIPEMIGATSSAGGTKGLVPAPVAGATRFLSSLGTWLEIKASASWGSISGTLSDQTDLSAALNGKIASSLIDFVFIYPNGGSASSPANISLNTRLINANPFPGSSVICEVECLVSGVWETPGWVSSSTQSPNSIGVRSSQRRGGSSDEIVTQSGSIANITGGGYTGGSYSGAYTTAALPVRVKVWKVKS